MAWWLPPLGASQGVSPSYRPLLSWHLRCLWHTVIHVQLLANQLEPLTEQQLTGIYNLRESSQQAEDALSQGMDALQQSLAETLANGTSGPEGSPGNVANYMGQMAMAMGKLGTLDGFLRQVRAKLKSDEIGSFTYLEGWFM